MATHQLKREIIKDSTKRKGIKQKYNNNETKAYQTRHTIRIQQE